MAEFGINSAIAALPCLLQSNKNGFARHCMSCPLLTAFDSEPKLGPICEH